MAYTDQQKRQHILELQRYLYGISLFDSRIPQIIPCGQYNSETAEAVRKFQQIYGLPQTGETDSDTWDMIVSVYRDSIGELPCPYAHHTGNAERTLFRLRQYAGCGCMR